MKLLRWHSFAVSLALLSLAAQKSGFLLRQAGPQTPACLRWKAYFLSCPVAFRGCPPAPPSPPVLTSASSQRRLGVTDAAYAYAVHVACVAHAARHSDDVGAEAAGLRQLRTTRPGCGVPKHACATAGAAAALVATVAVVVVAVVVVVVVVVMVVTVVVMVVTVVVVVAATVVVVFRHAPHLRRLKNANCRCAASLVSRPVTLSVLPNSVHTSWAPDHWNDLHPTRPTHRAAQSAAVRPAPDSTAVASSTALDGWKPTAGGLNPRRVPEAHAAHVDVVVVTVVVLVAVAVVVVVEVAAVAVVVVEVEVAVVVVVTVAVVVEAVVVVVAVAVTMAVAMVVAMVATVEGSTVGVGTPSTVVFVSAAAGTVRGVVLEAPVGHDM